MISLCLLCMCLKAWNSLACEAGTRVRKCDLSTCTVSDLAAINLKNVRFHLIKLLAEREDQITWMVRLGEWTSRSYSFSTETRSRNTAFTASCHDQTDSGKYDNGRKSAFSTSAG